MTTFNTGDAVWFVYGGESQVHVGHILVQREADALNKSLDVFKALEGDSYSDKARTTLINGEVVKHRSIYVNVERVEHVKDGIIHFFPGCSDDRPANENGIEPWASGDMIHPGLSWCVEHTTCLDCLRKRAHTLRGWRWLEETNAQEVAYLTKMLGDEVAGQENLEPEIAKPKRL